MNSTASNPRQNQDTALKAARQSLRGDLAAQIKVIEQLADFASTLLKSRQYTRAQELVVIIQGLESLTANLEKTATDLDREILS